MQNRDFLMNTENRPVEVDLLADLSMICHYFCACLLHISVISGLFKTIKILLDRYQKCTCSSTRNTQNEQVYADLWADLFATTSENYVHCLQWWTFFAINNVHIPVVDILLDSPWNFTPDSMNSSRVCPSNPGQFPYLCWTTSLWWSHKSYISQFKQDWLDKF